MRPRLLTVAAFGPFADETTVDLRPLDGRDLLLIEGPTGAGKTAILDAMTYALYGSVPGARDQARGDLKSAWAAPSARCEVSFEFSLGERIYRARRSPAQERRKKRGGGFTSERAEAHLCELKGDREVPLCPPRVADVDQAVARLLGLSAEQFKQVLLLPQGEFRRFLLASSPEKEALLEHLFGTTLYKEVAEQLREEQLLLERRAGDADRLRAELLAQRGVRTTEELEARIGLARAELAGLVVGADQAAAGAREERARSTAGGELAARLAERARAAEELRGLEAIRPRVEEARRVLAGAEQAAPLAGLFEREGQSREQLGRLRAEADRRTEEGRAAGLALERCLGESAAVGRMREERERLLVDEGLLERLVAVEDQLAARRRERTQAETRHRAAQRRLAGARGELAAAADRLQALEGELADAQRAASGEAVQQAEAARAGERARRRQELDEARQAAGKAARLSEAAARELVARRAAAEDARLAVELARRAREAGLASELAASLVPGEPCRVCGSREHPAPATATVDSVGPAAVAAREEDLAGARTQEARALHAAAQARSRAEAAGERAGELEGLLGDLVQADPLALVEAARALEERAREAGRQRERAAALASERGELTLRRQEREAAAQKVEDELRGLERSAERLRAEEEGLAAQLRAALPEGGDVRARRSAVHAETVRLGRSIAGIEDALQRARREDEAAGKLAAHARVALEEQVRVAGEVAVELARAARAAGFSDETAARLALIDEPGRLAGLRRTVAEWDQARARVGDRLAVLEVELAGAEAPDLPALARELEAAEAQAREALIRLGTARAQLAELERTAQVAREQDEQLRHAAERLSVLGPLARAVAGDNPLRMSLQRFVLASRVDEVAVAASARLLRMSRGRYSLRRTDAVKHGGRGSGLDLVVDDRETGSERSVHSLSGGEMFMASLSLAMGLADTVQAHAGGVRLGSLFIDEGFGTLDDESLDQVMRTLEDLRAGGRLVGVISHVPELRERMTTRLSVRREARGSTVKLAV